MFVRGISDSAIFPQL